MSTAPLKNGTGSMPLTGLGLWKLPTDVAADSVYAAIKAGYRLLDGAADYANEKECGEGVSRAIADGLVTREELFIVSKLWNTNHAAEHVEPAIRKSLADWGLEYFDLYLVHMPIPLKYVDPAVREHPGWNDGTPNGKPEVEHSPMHLTWGAMEAVHSKGLTRNIGISNFGGAMLLDMLCYAKTRPAVLQIELHPFHSQQAILDMCKVYGLHVMAYSSFGPQSWLELGHTGAQSLPSLFEVAEVEAIATAHQVTPAQVLLRWATQRGITVIPKSSKSERLAQNLANEKFNLTKGELESISGLNRGFRIAAPGDAHINIWA